jgi:hypothetical protein
MVPSLGDLCLVPVGTGVHPKVVELSAWSSPPASLPSFSTCPVPHFAQALFFLSSLRPVAGWALVLSLHKLTCEFEQVLFSLWASVSPEVQ